MNILIPDSWLRDFLKTKATPKQIKEYLSLCGPSVEHIHEVNGETVYDMEITTNRPDAMSVSGVAREAAAILPRFGIKATLVGDPYTAAKKGFSLHGKENPLKRLVIKVDHKLCPRFTTVVFENVKVGTSPDWLSKKLELAGVRSINNVVDITNYLMKAYGQPAHVFDFDSVTNGTMILRSSKTGEKIMTLDGKEHALPGNDIVIEDGSGKLIDLCGIMGGENSRVTDSTTTVILFVQTYDPVHIRKTSMALAHRSEASSLFEKGLDTELVMPVFFKGIQLLEELTGGMPASKLYDIYPKPYKSYGVSCSRKKIDEYIGADVGNGEIKTILEKLGFAAKVSSLNVIISVPSYRRDVTIDVDVIEEIARLYGYHNIKAKLPEGAPPVVFPDPMLNWEEELKIRLRDWGYAETYTYSMISENLMDEFHLDKTKAYKITNPLSSDWVYMRPRLLPSMIQTMEQNLHHEQELKFFELSMIYRFRPDDLPEERPTLIVAETGQKYFELKGIAQAIYTLFGIPFPEKFTGITEHKLQKHITVLELDVADLVAHAKPKKTFVPIPKYPAVVEDITFVVPPDIQVGPLMTAMRAVDPLIYRVELRNMYENTRTFHIMYLNPEKNLTNEDVKPIHEKIVSEMEGKFGATVKTLTESS